MKPQFLPAFAFAFTMLTACVHAPKHTQMQTLQSCDDVTYDADRSPDSISQCIDLYKPEKPPLPELSRQETQEKLNNPEFKPEEASPEEIAQLWRPLKLEQEFSREHSDAFWGSLLGIERLTEAKDSRLSPVAVFKESTSRYWYTANQKLSEIPQGKFQLTQELVTQINQSQPRAHRALSFQYFRTKLTESQFQALKQNASESGIQLFETPWSKPNKRNVIYWYANTKDSNQKLQDLYANINQRIGAIRTNRSQEDPIDLAAEFQWRFIQLRPFTQHNGLTSRAIMNRILQEFGLPPSSRKVIDQDFTLTLKEHQKYVREGVLESLKLVANQTLSARISPYKRGFGTRMTATEIRDLTQKAIGMRDLTNLKDLFPTSEQQVFTFQNKKFTLGDDLMLHDQAGVPHLITIEGNQVTIRPLTDKTYILYAMSGKLNNISFLQRDLNEAALNQARTSAEFFIALKKDPSLAEQVKVESYRDIEQANNKGGFYFDRSQIPLLKEVTLIKEDPTQNPTAVLVQNRGSRADQTMLGRSEFEKAYFLGQKSVETGEVIAQYMRMDQLYYELRTHIEKGREDFLKDPLLKNQLLDQIDISCEKLHTAARQLLKPLLDQIAQRTEQDNAYLMHHPQFRILYEYLNRTALAYPSVREARQNIDLEAMPVLRSAARSGVRFTGFVTNAQVRQVILGIPVLGPRFAKFVQEIYAEVSKMKATAQTQANPNLSYIKRKSAEYAMGNPSLQKGLESLMKYIFAEPYGARSLSPEMARAYVTEFLHTQLDLGPKERTSTTTHPNFLLRETKEPDQLAAKFAWKNAEIYILDVPRSETQIDIASGFLAQNEVGIPSLGPIKTRKAIRFTLPADNNNIYYLPKAPQTERAAEVMRLVFELPLP